MIVVGSKNIQAEIQKLVLTHKKKINKQKNGRNKNGNRKQKTDFVRHG